MNLAILFFCLFIILKQFYILESGSFQLGDTCLMLSAFFLLIDRKRSGKRRMLEQKIDWLFFLFVLATIVINGCYYIKYKDVHFIMASLYLCAEHGISLTGASPVTGIYRQV